MSKINKLKARNLIAGWPRGRSTTASAVNMRWQWDDFTMFYLHKAYLQRDIDRDREYHDDQARMLDWWHSQYRVPEDKFMVDCRGFRTRMLKPANGFVLAGTV